MPTPCANGCPFYGTPQTDNLCSACYRLANSSSNAKCRATPSSSTLAAVSAPSAVAAAASSGTPSGASPSSETPTSTSIEETSVPASILSTPVVPSQHQQQQQQQHLSPDTQLKSPSPLEHQQQQQQPLVQNDTEQGKKSIEEEIVETKPKGIPKNRCFVCRKKLGLTPFVCRCSHSFCSLHRMPNAHACEFDFKAHHRNLLTRDNPAILAKKIDKI